jgi:predicted TIM-barrel fold metal-dependent hydrolase
MSIVDTHVHAVSADRNRYPLRPVGGRVGEWVEARPTTTEDLIAEMDKAGVAKATFVQAATAYGFDNAYTVDSVRRNRNRFTGVCMVDVLDPAAPLELTRLVEMEGMRGIRLFTTTPPEAPWLDDPGTFPVWQRTRDLRIPLVIQVQTQHLARALKVVERFPEVPVLLDHLGNAQLLDAKAPVADLMAFAALPNVYLKFSTVNLYAIEKQGMSYAGYFQPILDDFGANRLMWGSNYPNTYDRPYTEMVHLAREAMSFLNEADQDLVFGGNAARLWPELR